MARALLDDVGDPGAEDAALAGQLLVDEIGDLVGREPGLRGGQGERDASDLRLLEHIEQAEAHLEPSVAEPLRLPDEQGVGETAFPFGKIHLGDLGRQRIDSADEYRAEAAASRKVLLDDFGDALRQRRFPHEGEHGNGNLIGAAPYDLDGELGAGGTGKESQYGKQRRDSIHSRRKYTVIVPSLSRPEFELQLSPELIGPVGPGQRRALP